MSIYDSHLIGFLIINTKNPIFCFMTTREDKHLTEGKWYLVQTFFFLYAHAKWFFVFDKVALKGGLLVFISCSVLFVTKFPSLGRHIFYPSSNIVNSSFCCRVRYSVIAWNMGEHSSSTFESANYPIWTNNLLKSISSDDDNGSFINKRVLLKHLLQPLTRFRNSQLFVE